MSFKNSWRFWSSFSKMVSLCGGEHDVIGRIFHFAMTAHNNRNRYQRSVCGDWSWGSCHIRVISVRGCRSGCHKNHWIRTLWLLAACFGGHHCEGRIQWRVRGHETKYRPMRSNLWGIKIEIIWWWWWWSSERCISMFWRDSSVAYLLVLPLFTELSHVYRISNKIWDSYANTGGALLFDGDSTALPLLNRW